MEIEETRNVKFDELVTSMCNPSLQGRGDMETKVREINNLQGEKIARRKEQSIVQSHCISARKTNMVGKAMGGGGVSNRRLYIKKVMNAESSKQY